jgi:hypothetical protein
MSLHLRIKGQKFRLLRFDHPAIFLEHLPVEFMHRFDRNMLVEIPGNWGEKAASCAMIRAKRNSSPKVAHYPENAP